MRVNYEHRLVMKEYILRNRHSAIVLIVTLIAFSIVNVYQVYSYEYLKRTEVNFNSLYLIRGDEPFYLAITSDIVQHHSIFMEMEFSGKNPDPHIIWPTHFYNNSADWFSTSRADGHYVSNYNPGLSYLLIPGYAIGGIFGAFMTISLVSSLTSVFIYKFTSKLTTSKIGFIITIIFSFATILFTYCNQVYPDVVITLFLVSCLYFIFEKRDSAFWLSAAGAILGYGVFLKFTFIIVDMVLIPLVFVFLVKRKVPSRNFLFFCIFFVILSVSAELNNLYTNNSLIGNSSSLDAINSAFGIDKGIYSHHYPNSYKIMFQELVEIFFGKYHGLFIFSPVVMLFVLGMKQFFCSNRLFFITTVIISILFIAGYTWVNPLSTLLAGDPPFRYFIPIIPLLSIPFALGFQTFSKSLTYKIMIFIFSSIGIAFSFGFANSHLSSVSHSIAKVSLVHLIYLGMDFFFPSLGPSLWCSLGTGCYSIPEHHPLDTYNLIFLITMGITLSIGIFISFIKKKSEYKSLPQS